MNCLIIYFQEKNKQMPKRRYIVELTEPQIMRLFSSLEVYELDLSGGYGFDDRCKELQRLHAVSYTHLTLPTTPYV